MVRRKVFSGRSQSYITRYICESFVAIGLVGTQNMALSGRRNTMLACFWTSSYREERRWALNLSLSKRLVKKKEWWKATKRALIVSNRHSTHGLIVLTIDSCLFSLRLSRLGLCLHIWQESSWGSMVIYGIFLLLSPKASVMHACMHDNQIDSWSREREMDAAISVCSSHEEKLKG